MSRDSSDPLVGQLWSVPDGSQVREEQMKALFGEGLHPNADQITRHLTGAGVAKAGALAGARLGRPFRVNAEENEWTRRLRAAYGDYNTTIGEDRTASPSPTPSAPTSAPLVAREMFTEHHGRPPADDRELSGFIARQSRAQTTAVAGYDLTFTPVKSVSVLWALAPRSMARDDRGLPPSGGRRNDQLPRGQRGLFPHGRRRHRPGQHHRADRRRVRPPRLTRRATPTCTPTSQ